MVGKRLDAAIAGLQGEYALYVVGRKAMAHAERMGYPVTQYLEDFNLEKMTFAEAASISSMLVAEFRKGNLSGVSVCFTRFVSMMRYVPEIGSFLPIAEDSSEVVSEAADVILEPSAPKVMGSIVPRYLETRIYHALLESITSEYASRRFAMTNATEAAGDMKTEITREYNRARQQKITSEILEIVSGAEAL
jgi:F-type H+-transporting ATPase subunit gamma